jgi:hypothetical protein
MIEARPAIRLDKWLWQARFAKSRALAAQLIAGGAVAGGGAAAHRDGTCEPTEATLKDLTKETRVLGNDRVHFFVVERLSDFKRGFCAAHRQLQII